MFRANCAGQGCADRDGCRRYVLRLANGKQRGRDGEEHPVFAWVSWDLERVVRPGGDCAGFVRMRGA